jgi:hypothetical protein
VIEQSVVSFFGLGHHGDLSSFEIANTSITEWVKPSPDEKWWRPGGQWRLVRLNDAAHLEVLGEGRPSGYSVVTTPLAAGGAATAIDPE